MNITEEKIFQQFEPAVDAIVISRPFALQIAEGLNKMHEQSKEASRKQSAAYREALKGLERQEDRLYLDLRSDVIDDDGYGRRLRKIREERDHLSRLLECNSEAINDVFTETAKSIIELAIDAKSLWKNALPVERLSYLKKICSNQTLDGVTISYQLQKPYLEISGMSEMKENQEWRTRKDSNLRPLDS